MKKNILKIFITLVVAVGITVGVSHVFAENTDTNTAPAPIHTGGVAQNKEGDIWIKKVLGAPIGIFKKMIYLPGSDSSLHIGSPDDAPASKSFNKNSSGAISQLFNTTLFNETHKEPLVIDMADRSVGTASIDYIHEALKDSCVNNSAVYWTTNAPAFEFKTSATNERSNIIAKGLRLSGGNPQKNAVLVGDANGNARWSKAEVKNGVVVFNTKESVIYDGNSCLVPPEKETPKPVVLGCMNNTANNFNPTATEDDGSCVQYEWSMEWGQCVATPESIAEAKAKADNNIKELQNTLTPGSILKSQRPELSLPWYVPPEPAYMVKMEDAYNASNIESAKLGNGVNWAKNPDLWMPVSFDNGTITTPFMQIWSATTRGNHSRLASSYTFPQVGMTQSEQDQAKASGQSIEGKTLNGTQSITKSSCIRINLSTGAREVIGSEVCTDKGLTQPTSNTTRTCNTAIIPAVTKNFAFRTVSWEQVGFEVTPAKRKAAAPGYKDWDDGFEAFQKIALVQSYPNNVVYYDASQKKCVLEDLGQKTLNVANTYYGTPSARSESMTSGVTLFSYVSSNQTHYNLARKMKGFPTYIVENPIADDRSVQSPSCIDKIPFNSSPAFPQDIINDAYSLANFGYQVKPGNGGYDKARFRYYTLQYKLLNP